MGSKCGGALRARPDRLAPGWLGMSTAREIRKEAEFMRCACVKSKHPPGAWVVAAVRMGGIPRPGFAQDGGSPVVVSALADRCRRSTKQG